jgi:hypothetical protein
MTMADEGYRRRVAVAESRIARGNAERTAGADDRARAIAGEVGRRGRGGARQVADELGVSEKAISEAVRRARGLSGGYHALPGDTLERLLAAELPSVGPLAEAQWQALAWLVRGIVIDPLWIGLPGQLLACEVEDAELEPEFSPDVIADACRSWTRVQALAVIDACQRDALDTLPTKEQP